MSYLNLIRYKNLLFLLLMMWCMQRCVAEPILAIYGFDSQNLPLQTWQFALLCTAVICIAAAGYAINDYFDVKIDTINHPVTRIVGVSIERSQAMLCHQVLTVIGVIAGIALAVSLRNLMLGALFVFVPGLLWFYSASYKRQFLVGNIIVALTVATSVMVVALANVGALRHIYNDKLLSQTPIVPNLYGWIGAFALFAFLLTWIREVLKDAEDQEGDREMECRTMPVKYGEKITKIAVIALILITAATLAWLIFRHANNSLTWRYAGFGIMMPLAVLAVMVAIAKNRADYKNAQQLAKYIMLIGTLYSFVFYYITAKITHIPFFGLFAA